MHHKHISIHQCFLSDVYRNHMPNQHISSDKAELFIDSIFPTLLLQIWIIFYFNTQSFSFSAFPLLEISFHSPPMIHCKFLLYPLNQTSFLNNFFFKLLNRLVWLFNNILHKLLSSYLSDSPESARRNINISSFMNTFLISWFWTAHVLHL